MTRVISWTLSSEVDARAPQNDITSIHQALAEIYRSLQRWTPTRRKVIFASIHVFAPDWAKHESIAPLSPTASGDGGLLLTPPPPSTTPFLTFFAREQHLENFVEGLLSNSLRLLVAVSGLLSKDDYESLCPLLWQSCLTQGRSQIQISVSLLSEVNTIDARFSAPHRQLS